jgi:polysaccharide biosynthesis/export protein
MKSHYVLISLLLILIITSCTSTKEILMFQDSGEDLSSLYVPAPLPEPVIKPFDNLYLNIVTLDPEVNRIFNPSSGGGGYSGTQQMYGDPTSQYINGYRVSADSTVTIPILGKLNFVGLNLLEAQIRLKERADEYLKESTVQVKFLNYKVNIAGEIRSPGLFYNYEGNINILDALGMANGITEFADLKNVIVKRQDENKVITHKLDLTNNSVYSSEVYYLQPNDVIYIPPSKLKRRSTNSDAYGKFLGTISALLLGATLILNL